MNNIFFKKPTKQVEDFIKQRGKLVIYLTNGKYVTFTKEELKDIRGYFRLNTVIDSNDIGAEPIRSKVLEAAGTTSKSCISRVVDRYGVITGFGGGTFQNCSNLESVLMTETLTPDYKCFAGCSSLKYVYLPKLYNNHRGEKNNMFNGCSSLEQISLPGIEDFYQSYQAFNGCSRLHTVDLRNVKTFTSNNDSIFSGCTSLKKLSFPKCESITYMYGFSFNAPNMEVLDMPRLSVIDTNNPIFRTEVSCKKAILGQIPLATIQAKSAWGLPAGCEVIGKDGSYVI